MENSIYQDPICRQYPVYRIDVMFEAIERSKSSVAEPSQPAMGRVGLRGHCWHLGIHGTRRQFLSMSTAATVGLL